MVSVHKLEPRLHGTSEARYNLEPPRPGRRQRLILEPRLHTESVDEEPYYDEELDVMTLPPHRRAISLLEMSLEHVIASALGLEYASDHPIWYESVDGSQRVFRPDAVLLRAGADVRRATAREALFVLEVVSTNDRRKELKDTITMKATNELNEVPEFALLYPDLDDARCLELFRLDEGAYSPVRASVNGRYVSEAVPGLELEVLPKSRWADGRKIDVYFRGQRCLWPEEAVQRADSEKQRADSEKKRADEEQARADEAQKRAVDEQKRADEAQERAMDEQRRADALAAKLKALGIDPSEL